MTRDERGRVLSVPVRLVGVVVMWMAAVALLIWNTFGGPDTAGDWGLLMSAGAAAWSVLYGMRQKPDQQLELLRHAFELGQDAGSADVQRIR